MRACRSRSCVEVLIPDINVLVGAFRAEAKHHTSLRRWLDDVVRDDVVGLAPAVATGYVRVVTNRRIYADDTTPLEVALAHIESLRSNASVVDVTPGARHGDIFARLCQATGATGNLVADAAHAAVAIEHGATWVTTDTDFVRFPGLRYELLRFD